MIKIDIFSCQESCFHLLIWNIALQENFLDQQIITDSDQMLHLQIIIKCGLNPKFIM